MNRKNYKVLFTLLVGMAGALIASSASLPAPSLIGAAIAVTIASVFGYASDIPHFLRNIAFIIIGISLGSGLTKQAFSQAVHWPVSLAVLGLSVLLTLLTGSYLLSRFFNQRADTAFLAIAPGALVYSLSIAMDGIGDIRAIVVIQSVRVLLVTTLIPLILEALDLGIGPAGINSSLTMGFMTVTIVACISFAAAVAMQKMKVPAAFFLGGILISGIAHFLGLVEGRPSPEITYLGFAVTGTVVGARFASIPLKDLKKLFGASMFVFAYTGIVAAIFALFAAYSLELPFGQVFVAYAPGGVEAMAAMALALGYDGAFVATHHLFRILLLFILIPLMLRLPIASGERVR